MPWSNHNVSLENIPDYNLIRFVHHVHVLERKKMSNKKLSDIYIYTLYSIIKRKNDEIMNRERGDDDEYIFAPPKGVLPTNILQKNLSFSLAPPQRGTHPMC